MKQISRREFFKIFGTAALGFLAASKMNGCSFLSSSLGNTKKTYPGNIVGARFAVGHLLRKQEQQAKPARTLRCETLIIGGGISGLSAAWQLDKQGRSDYILCDLEDSLGGNARSGANSVSSYPWGAHYLPVPNQESGFVRDFLRDIQVITGTDAAGRDIYNEEYICHDPEERLFIRGTWQEGLIPAYGIDAAEKKEIARFHALMNDYKNARGKDGKPAFAIPLDLSSQDEKFLALDSMNMKAFLLHHGFKAPSLYWYVNYSCLDDYGTLMENTSAWAGIHYFASRRGNGAGLEDDAVLTWPAGNGWLASKMLSRLKGEIMANALVYSLKSEAGDMRALILNPATNETQEISARKCIYAAPRFTFHRVFRDDVKFPYDVNGLQYAPWMVANITLEKPPAGRGMDLCWDNVLYDSASLGYVHARHQDLSGNRRGPTVITYYQPLPQGEPKQMREWALTRTHSEWCESIVADLSRAHPSIANTILNIDVWLWGHGMVRPAPDFIWGKTRAAMRAPLGNITFAHSDMSGISIFEEAQYHGVRAANPEAA